jgi:hypothetical protein
MEGQTTGRGMRKSGDVRHRGYYRGDGGQDNRAGYPSHPDGRLRAVMTVHGARDRVWADDGWGKRPLVRRRHIVLDYFLVVVTGSSLGPDGSNHT